MKELEIKIIIPTSRIQSW